MRCTECKGELRPYVDEVEAWRDHTVGAFNSLWRSLQSAVNDIPIVDLHRCEKCSVYGFQCVGCDKIEVSRTRMTDGTIISCSRCQKDNMVRNPSRIFSSK